MRGWIIKPARSVFRFLDPRTDFHCYRDCGVELQQWTSAWSASLDDRNSSREEFKELVHHLIAVLPVALGKLNPTGKRGWQAIPDLSIELFHRSIPSPIRGDAGGILSCFNDGR